jgi:hypothetical protein
MQAALLRARTSCPDAVLKDWVRKGVIIPVTARAGPGLHADYDDANVVALAAALQLDRLHVTVPKYGVAFRDLHQWLRLHSAIEWTRSVAIFRPDSVEFVRRDGPVQGTPPCCAVDLGIIVEALVPLDSGSQLQLQFGMSSVA